MGLGRPCPIPVTKSLVGNARHTASDQNWSQGRPGNEARHENEARPTLHE